MQRKAIHFDQILSEEAKKTLPKESIVKSLRAQFIDPLQVNTALVPLRDLLGLYANGDIEGYIQNRGSGKSSKSTANDVRDEYNPDAMGTIMVGVFPDLFVAGEGHGRGTGVCLRYNGIGFTEEELRDVISLRMVSPEKFLKTYQDYNNQHKHTINNCLANQDLAFGKVIGEILDELEEIRPGITQEMDKGKNYPILADVVWALQKENTVASYFGSFKEVYAIRREVSKLANKQASDLKISISSAQKKRLKSALVYWYDYISALRDMEKEYKIKVVRTFRSKGWMGVVLCDRLFNHKNPVLHKAPLNLAKASYSHAIDVRTYIPEITRVKLDVVNHLVRDIDSILRGRKVASR